SCRSSKRSGASSPSAACRSPSEATTGFPLPAPTACTTSPSYRSGLRLGIAVERIRPGQPQPNGRQERMHLTQKKEATRPPGMNSLQQQARFDRFVSEFNHERPHEALAMKSPTAIYTPAVRPYRGLPELHYPFHDRDALVTACGRICM